MAFHQETWEKIILKFWQPHLFSLYGYFKKPAPICKLKGCYEQENNYRNVIIQSLVFCVYIIFTVYSVAITILHCMFFIQK